MAATELKAKLAEYLGDVECGEVINVTRHGKTIAQIKPANNDRDRQRREALEAFRAWRRTLPPTKITVEDILSAREEGRK